jgi:hypothetical protein
MHTVARPFRIKLVGIIARDVYMPGGRDPRDEPIPTNLVEIDNDIEYWSARLDETEAGSHWVYWVQVRLNNLRQAKHSFGAHDLESIMQPSVQGEIKVFISHSSRDQEVVKRIITLVRSALNLSASAIRCTSVDGYRLPAGTPTDEVLRQEIHDSAAFVALITPRSLKSAYVLFEIGGRWATRKPFFPLVCGAETVRLVRGPLASLNCLRCDNEPQLFQFTDELARALRMTLESPAVYHKCIIETVEIASKQLVKREIATT